MEPLTVIISLSIILGSILHGTKPADPKFRADVKREIRLALEK